MLEEVKEGEIHHTLMWKTPQTGEAKKGMFL